MNQNDRIIEMFNKYAKAYQDKFMEKDTFHGTFDLFCELVEKKNARILDIACGPGNISKYLLNKRPDFKLLGIDLSDKMIELAKINNPSADFQLIDGRDISQFRNKYDGIVAGFILPYLSKEETIKLIHDAANILEENGVLYLSTMEDDYSKSGLKGGSSNPEEKLYIHFHEVDYLRQALKENNFDIIDEQRKDYPETDGSITIDLVLLAKKEVA
ncbi:MAG: class I SAM-dependent methyltransferase [Saprospiraceae bacterium]